MHKTAEPTKKRTALGQGLNALIPIEAPLEKKSSDTSVLHIPIGSLRPNPHQPRRVFSEESLVDLSNSIKEMGVIQPLIVRETSEKSYELVAGERRWRAATLAGFKTIPVIVKEVNDSESLEIALIENLQREDLNPMDTAEAYDILIKKFSYTHDVLAKRMGKDRTSITNYLRLLRLPDPIKSDLRQDKLSMGHARTLLSVEDLSAQLTMSRKVVKRKLSVRELERIVQNYRNKSHRKQSNNTSVETGADGLATKLSRHFETKVAIQKNTNDSGKIIVHFHSGEELERLLDRFGFSDDFS